jgi:DNA-directed RNA polymerase specialized sigma24 family protein
MFDGSQLETSVLVKHARSSDKLVAKEAFATLVSRYEEGIYAYILGRCHDPERAQEVVQDGFITAYTTHIGQAGEAGEFQKLGDRNSPESA